jgi:hypothetical protein
MKKSLVAVFFLCICLAFAMSAFAQPQGKDCPMKKGKCLGHCAAMDANKDGKISKEEWTNFHNKMFEDTDKNKDGSIDQKEMGEHLQKRIEEKQETKKGK